MFEKIKQLLYLTLGHFFLVAGIVGALLPIVPAIPFFILASACYIKGSKKLHERLRNNRWLGEAIRNWEDRGVISLRAKCFFVGMLLVSTISAFFLLSVLWVKLGVAMFATLGIWFVVTRKS